MKKYLRMVVIYGIFFVLVSIISAKLAGGPFWIGLISGLVFAVALTLVLSVIHIRSVKKEGGDDFDIDRKETITLPTSKKNAFDLCLDSVEKLKKESIKDKKILKIVLRMVPGSWVKSEDGEPEIKEKDLSQGKIVVKTAPNWNSFGEMVTYELEEKEESVEVTIESNPLSAQAIDYGESLKNIKKVVEFLKEKS